MIDETLIEKIARATDLSAEQVEKLLDRVNDVAGSPSPATSTKLQLPVTEFQMPAGWPTLSRGELVDVKGIWFEVIGMQDDLLYLKSRGPTAALIKRVAHKAAPHE